jgi:hypothetical protein
MQQVQSHNHEAKEGQHPAGPGTGSIAIVSYEATIHEDRIRVGMASLG